MREEPDRVSKGISDPHLKCHKVGHWIYLWWSHNQKSLPLLGCHLPAWALPFNRREYFCIMCNNNNSKCWLHPVLKKVECIAFHNFFVCTTWESTPSIFSQDNEHGLHSGLLGLTVSVLDVRNNLSMSLAVWCLEIKPSTLYILQGWGAWEKLFLLFLCSLSERYHLNFDLNHTEDACINNHVKRALLHRSLIKTSKAWQERQIAFLKV